MSAMSVETIARLLDMTPRRVQQLVKENILPKPVARGQYDAVRCSVAYIRYLNGRLDGDVGDLNSEKTRLTRAQAVKIERENAAEEGKLIPLADAIQGWSELVSAAKSKLLNMPGRLAPSLANTRNTQEVERILAKAVNEALVELADWKPADDSLLEPSPLPSGEDMGATEGDHGQPMG